MPRNNEKEKKFSILEKNVSIISAVNNPKLGPYLDIFRHFPENVLLQNSGVLAGFFKINDLSEESAYIVNFLSSILKKEYYANPKRPIENSFDSALRKVNLALSEIAKEGNINWLGKIDGCVAVLEKNNLHFSVCGNAKVFLFRSQSLSEISRDMASGDAEPNPLKTFVDVSSGRLEKEDKLIICESDVFGVFSEEEMRKGAIRFPGEKFIQFLKTALTNKLEIVGALIVDVFEKKEEKRQTSTALEETYNVFSKKVFEEKKPGGNELSKNLDEEMEKEYTDEKTGHIYIQEEKEGLRKENQLGIFWILCKEKIGDTYYWLKNRAKKRAFSIGRSASKTSSNLISAIRSGMEERKKIRAQKKEQLEMEKEKLSQIEASLPETKEEEKLLAAKNEAEIPVRPVYEEPFLERLARRKEELEREERESLEKSEPENTWKKRLLIFKKIIPDFGKIKGLFLALGKKQKIYSVAAIALIVVAPLVFLKIQASMKKEPVSQETQQKIPSPEEIFSEEKNIAFLDSLEKISPLQDPKKIIILEGKIIAINADKIIAKEEGKEIKEVSWPRNYGAIKEVSSMKDLDMALIYTDQNKVISFLSATSQLKENSISIPEGAKITGSGSYLTYLYLLDASKNQIYRYPRAEGGFGEKADWFKEEMSLVESNCLTIDENVYLINGNKVLKLFKGKSQEFSLEQTVNPFTPDEIYTDSDVQSIYALDKGTGRIIRFGKDGTLLSQYFHEDIKKSSGFTVDEKNGKVYVINPEGLFSFSL